MSLEYYSFRFAAIGIIALFYLIIGSISDLKTREVLNYSNFSLIAIGFTLNALFAVSSSDYMIMLESIAGFVVCYIIAYVMYYTGQWGGGDAKLLMGLGALFGFQFNFSTMPFVIEFFINTLLLGAIYGMLWSLTLAMIHIKTIYAKLQKKLKEKRKERYVVLSASVALFLIAIAVQDFIIKILLLVTGLFIMLMFYAWIFTKIVEKAIMYKSLDPKDITEGEWIVDDVVVDKKTFEKKGKVTEDMLDKISAHAERFKKEIEIKKNFLFFHYTKKAKITNLEPGFVLDSKKYSEDDLKEMKIKIRKNTLLAVKIKRNGKTMIVDPHELKIGDTLLEDIEEGFLVTGPSDLGIDNYQIEILRDLKSKGKIDKVLIKEGIPFVPSFLFGFVATVLFPGLLFSFM